jgi:hypothetical protein
MNDQASVNLDGRMQVTGLERDPQARIANGRQGRPRRAVRGSRVVGQHDPYRARRAGLDPLLGNGPQSREQPAVTVQRDAMSPARRPQSVPVQLDELVVVSAHDSLAFDPSRLPKQPAGATVDLAGMGCRRRVRDGQRQKTTMRALQAHPAPASRDSLRICHAVLPSRQGASSACRTKYLRPAANTGPSFLRRRTAG